MKDKPVAAGKSSFDLIDRERLFSLLKLTPKTVFLDLASGAGRYSLEVAKRMMGRGEVHAVDLWAEGIDVLNERIREQHLANVHTVIADITKPLPLTTAYYDVCLLATVLHDLSEQGRDEVLRETARLLKQEGILAVVEFKKTDQGPGPPVHVRLSAQDLEKEAAKQGFSMRVCEDLGEYTYSCIFGK